MATQIYDLSLSTENLIYQLLRERFNSLGDSVSDMHEQEIVIKAASELRFGDLARQMTMDAAYGKDLIPQP